MTVMTSNLSRCSVRHLGAVIAAVAALAGCSGPQAGKQSSLLGYGTPGVSSYVQGGPASTLQEELDRCRGLSPNNTGSQTQSLQAACAQLLRTVRNQPGNSVQSD